MKMKTNNKGISLVELIVTVLIMAILVVAISPNVMKFVEKARQVEVEKEASAFTRAVQLAFVEVSYKGNVPKSDVIKHQIKNTNSPYYKNGTLYGNLTNWTVRNGVVATASNAAFGEKFFELLGISIGGDKWKNQTIPISATGPKDSSMGSLTKECIFQIFYDKDFNIVVEYSRMGYFVRMENSLMQESVKIKNSADTHFTAWKN